jgi:hypothetical protein
LFRNFLESWGETQKASFSYLLETNTYRLLEKISAKLPFRPKQDTPKPRLDAEALSSAVIRNYIQNVSIVDLLAKQFGFRPIFAWYPNLEVGHKELTPYEEQVQIFQDQAFPDLRAMYQAVYNKSGEIKSPDFYNLADLVDGQKKSIYIGISHMRPEGDQIVANRLFEILQQSGTGLAFAAGGGTGVGNK